MRIVRAILFVSLLVGALPSLHAREPLSPPFGLRWGDAPNRLVEWAMRTGLDQTVKSPADEPRLKILVINPAKGSLPDHEASAVEARFMDGRLFEVALHYTYPGKSAVFVKGKFRELKSILTRRHGMLRLSGKKREGPRDGIVIESMGYRIDPSSRHHLVLALTEVMDAKRGDAAARFSVIYHNAGVLNESDGRVVIRPEGPGLPEGLPEMEADPALPAGQ